MSVRRLTLTGMICRDNGKLVSSYHSWPLGAKAIEVQTIIDNFRTSFCDTKMSIEYT